MKQYEQNNKRITKEKRTLSANECRGQTWTSVDVDLRPDLMSVNVRIDKSVDKMSKTSQLHISVGCFWFMV